MPTDPRTLLRRSDWDQPHEPILLTKVGSAYVTDDGEEVPSHRLHRFECSCGNWKGAAWYASEDRARRHFDRHADEMREAEGAYWDDFGDRGSWRAA